MKDLLDKGARSSERVEPDHWWDKQHSLVLRQTPRWAQSFVLGLVLLSGGAIGASAIIRVDEVVSVEGILTPTTGSIEVKSPAGGLVDKVFAGDGESVAKDEILLRFDTRRATDQLIKLKLQLKELKLTYESRRRAANQRRKTFEKKLDTNKLILERLKYLKENGAIDGNTVLQQEDTTLELESTIFELQEEMLQLKSNYDEQKSRIESDIFLNELQIQYETVTSPGNGVIFDSKASPRGVLSAGEAIMKIVPQDKLIADVWVTNKDIGYIKIGQKAKIRVAAYDYTEFGEIQGQIVEIDADVIPPDQELDQYRYGVKIELEKNNLTRKGIDVPVISGMAITANIKLRDKRLISIVSDIFSDNEEAIIQLRQ